MKLDDLQRQWQLLDQKLDSSIQVQREFMRYVAIETAHHHVRWMLVRPALDMMWCVIIVWCGGVFIYRNWPTATLIIPSGLLLIGAVVTFVDYVLEASRAARIDWKNSVADIQSRLSQIRIMRLRRMLCLLLLSPLFGFCLLVVAVRMATGVNVIEQFNGRWVVANIAFGLVCIPIGWLLIRVARRRWSDRAWWNRLVDDMSGGSLKAARFELDRWSELRKSLP